MDLEGELLSDEELAELAVSADPDAALRDDAVPFLPLGGAPAGGALPGWYMPAVALRHSRGARRAVLLGIVAILVLLEALGLCSVFGQVVIG